MTTRPEQTWTVRPVRDEELPAWLAVPSRNFHDPQPPVEADLDFLRRRYATQNLTAAVDGDAIVGAFRTWDIDLPVPGGTARAEAVSSVAVLPTHRRRGILTAMMERSLGDAKERGCAASILIASSAEIYGRYGYGVATEHCTWTLDSRSARFRDQPEPAAGAFDLELCFDADLEEVAPLVYQRSAVGMPGAMPRDELTWKRILGTSGLSSEDRSKVRPAVVLRSGGEPVGYARYFVDEATQQRVDTSTLTLRDLAAVDHAAYAALWRFLASLDLVATVTAGDRPLHEPLPWLLHDRRAVRQTDRADFQWVRLLDVPAALAARTYAATGAFVVEVVDPAGLSSARVLLETDGSAAEVTDTTKDPDLTLPLHVLGSIYLGQVSLTDLWAAGLVGEHTEGAVRGIDALFAYRPTSAVGHTWF